jgi:hypothetical protein
MSTYPKNADIVVSFSTFSTIWQFTPVSVEADSFLANDCGFEDWQSFGGTYCVDSRPAKDFAHFLADQGFVLFHPEHGYFQPAI